MLVSFAVILNEYAPIDIAVLFVITPVAATIAKLVVSLIKYDTVSASDLRDWIDLLYDDTSADIHYWYMACHSGSFIDEIGNDRSNFFNNKEVTEYILNNYTEMTVVEKQFNKSCLLDFVVNAL